MADYEAGEGIVSTHWPLTALLGHRSVYPALCAMCRYGNYTPTPTATKYSSISVDLDSTLRRLPPRMAERKLSGRLGRRVFSQILRADGPFGREFGDPRIYLRYHSAAETSDSASCSRRSGPYALLAAPRSELNYRTALAGRYPSQRCAPMAYSFCREPAW